jgi:hypothetical protein
LLETDVNTDSSHIEDPVDDDRNDFMNRPISKEELLLAFRKLKNRKAAGPDGIISEILKNSSEKVVDFFLKLFNTLFDCGEFPQNWTESIILPLFKKGNVNNPNNYRGICLSNISCKLFSVIINNRLQEWVEENNLTGEQQAGFKKGYSTVDHMFTLLAFVQKQFSLNRKLYVAFIDFEKAFDSINRNILWPILFKSGVKGKLFDCIKSMYDNVKLRVRCGANVTDFINCSAGVKQGDACSPVLFSIFINELALEVINNGRHGASFMLDAFELFILLLADDVILFAETIVGLQTQLNNLHQAACSFKLKVNMTKSTIIVFRKGGCLGSREKWVYDGAVMPVVNVYTYLGIIFSTRLSFVAACKDLASRAKNALLCIMQKLYILNNNSFELLIKLLDSQVQPIVQYGSEIWGLDKAAAQCESVHLLALKRYLGVELRTPNDFVYSETNRYPIYINSAVSCVRYWLKLLKMEDCRLPYKAYKMLCKLDANGKRNWVSNVRSCLYQHGFGHVWDNQGSGCDISFISAFRQRLIDCRWQNWHEHISNSDRFSLYRTFCDTHELKSYLTMNIDRHLKCLTARFRFGISVLNVHKFRYK